VFCETCENLIDDIFISRANHNLVGITIGNGLDGRVSTPGKGKRFVSSPRPERPKGPSNFRSNGLPGDPSAV
jgi:hypothetical protein